MSIISFRFLIFLGCTFGLFFLVPRKAKRYVLLAASYVYYYSVSNWLIVFLLFTTLVVYFVGFVMGRIDKQVAAQCLKLEKGEKKIIKRTGKRKKRLLLVLSVIINLGILIVMKYTNLITGTLNSLIGTSIPAVKWFLPLGISYYTLQAISYLTDVYHGNCGASRDPVKVALFLSFFPHILEGPFSRFGDVGEQLSTSHSFDYSRAKFGLQLMIWGYFKKMIVADRAAQFVNQVFNHSNEYTGVINVLAVVLYTLQIYAEFSGCIDIMTGIAQVLGVSLPLNFRQPFFAKSVQEFWQRWHITLGLWMKEYVFYPISCSKLCVRMTEKAARRLPRVIASTVPVAFALFFVWLFNGFWHGVGWKYVAYGLYYYAFMLVSLIFAPLSRKVLNILKVPVDKFGYRLWQMLRTSVIVLIGMLIFRADSLHQAWDILMNSFTIKGMELVRNGQVLSIGFDVAGEWLVLALGVIAMFVVDILHESGHSLRMELSTQPLLFRWLVYYAGIIAIIVFGVYGMGYDAQAFIYAGF